MSHASEITVSLFIIYNCLCDTHEDMKITAFDISGDQYNPPMPFANLLHLNLANNLIFEEGGLLALMGWHSLRELVLWGNPLTTAFKGDPPILSFQLGRLKGVRIFRYETLLNFYSQGYKKRSCSKAVLRFHMSSGTNRKCSSAPSFCRT